MPRINLTERDQGGGCSEEATGGKAWRHKAAQGIQVAARNLEKFHEVRLERASVGVKAISQRPWSFNFILKPQEPTEILHVKV